MYNDFHTSMDNFTSSLLKTLERLNLHKCDHFGFNMFFGIPDRLYISPKTLSDLEKAFKK